MRRGFCHGCGKDALIGGVDEASLFRKRVEDRGTGWRSVDGRRLGYVKSEKDGGLAGPFSATNLSGPASALKSMDEGKERVIR